MPHGVLFRGNVEGEIRKEIITKGYIKGIIGLPANLFYGTGIPACIIVLDKEFAKNRQEILMIDASKGFIKDGNKNRLRAQDVHKIVDVFNNQKEIKGYSRRVSIDEIVSDKNNYNLNLPRYIDNDKQEDIHDLTAHLRGGIPKRDIDNLNNYWHIFKTLRQTIFKEDNDSEYAMVKIPVEKIHETIINSQEYRSYTDKMIYILYKWQAKNEIKLKELTIGSSLKKIIYEISEELLNDFTDFPLIDKYDIYQYLMDYWSEIMQDDVSLIGASGWQKAAEISVIQDEIKSKKLQENPDIIIGSAKKAQKFKAGIVPVKLIMAKYFATEEQTISKLQQEKETILQDLEEFLEEHNNEEGLLAEVKNDKGKLTKTALTSRVNEIKNDSKFTEDLKVLRQALEFISKEAKFTDEIKKLQVKLDLQIIDYSQKLSEDYIKKLVVNEKWFAKLASDLMGELERVTYNLTNRIKELEERYKKPLPEIISQLNDLNTQVDSHLKKMGLVW